MVTKRIIGILGIFVIGIALGIVFATFSPINLTDLFAADVSSNIEKLYELINPGINVEVVKIDEISGLYKVLFKATDVAGGVTYRESYITKDGKLLTETVILVEQSIEQLARIQSFVDCLVNKNLRIAGITNHTATLLQFNILGGSYATKLYLSCDGELAQQCVAANITQVPSVVYQNTVYPDVQPIQFFENLTGCKF